MGTLSLVSGRLTADGAAPYHLPENITREFIEALLSYEAGEELFIGEISRSFTPEDKQRLQAAGKAVGGDTWKGLASASLKYAAVVNNDSKWHIEDFDVIYNASINTWWVHDILITTSNVRFLDTTRGLMTFPEFNWLFGANIVEHMDRYVKQTATDFENIKRAITSEVHLAELQVVDHSNNTLVISHPVVTGAPRDEWLLPSTYRLLDVVGQR